MPFAVRRKGSKYQVINTDTNRVYATTTHSKAEKRLALLQSIERDWTPTDDGGYERVVNGKNVKLHIV